MKRLNSTNPEFVDPEKEIEPGHGMGEGNHKQLCKKVPRQKAGPHVMNKKKKKKKKEKKERKREKGGG
jgi:hypothetical protein